MPTEDPDGRNQPALTSAIEKLESEIAEACEVHEQYLAEYGSLGDVLRASSDPGG